MLTRAVLRQHCLDAIILACGPPQLRNHTKWIESHLSICLEKNIGVGHGTVDRAKGTLHKSSSLGEV